MKQFLFLVSIPLFFYFNASAQYYFNKSENITTAMEYRGNSVLYMPNGDYVISGMVVDTIKLSPTVELLKNGTNTDCYVAWYKNDGSLKWHFRSKTITGSSSISENGIKADENYNIYLVGSFSGKKYFSSSIHTYSYGYSDAYCLVIDSSGNVKHLMHIADSEGYALAIDKGGNIIIGGKGNNDFGRKQAFLAKFDKNGNFIKSEYFLGTTSNRDYITSLDVDQNNNIYFTGLFNSTKFGLQSLPKLTGSGSVNHFDFFVGKLNDTIGAAWMDGSFILSTNYPTTFVMNEILIDTLSNSLYLGGYYSGNYRVANDTLLYYSNYNYPTPILINMDVNGNYKWKSLLGFVNQNNYGYVYDLLLNHSGLWSLLSVTNTSKNQLLLGDVNYDPNDKGLLICSIDTLGNVESGFGSEPDSSYKIVGRSFSYLNNSGFIVGLFQNDKDRIYFGNEALAKGNSLVFAKECGVQSTILNYSKTSICYGDSIELSVQNINTSVDWYKDGNLLAAKSSKIYVFSTGDYFMEAKDANACPIKSDTVGITVNPLPVVSFSGLSSDYCADDSSVTLVGSPVGGTFTGSGMAGTTFDPQNANIGVVSIDYSYTDGNACTNSAFHETTVHSLPTVDFTGLDTSYCMNDVSAQLTGIPTDGIFSGAGIKNNDLFDPSVADLGSNSISYYYKDSFGCENIITKKTNVYGLPLVGFTGLDSLYCAENKMFSLMGNPSGGVFSGNGISGNNFNPSNSGAGISSIFYSYTDIHGCTNSDKQTTRVLALPNVSFSGLDTAYCPDDSSVVLSGNPIGGVFSGAGISGNSFDPSVVSVGIHTIEYTYTDMNQCTNSDKQSTRIKYPSECVSSIDENNRFPKFTVYPNPASSEISIIGLENYHLSEIYIIDVLGKKYQVNIFNSNKVSINTFAKGFYIMEIRLSGESYFVNFIIE